MSYINQGNIYSSRKVYEKVDTTQYDKRPSLFEAHENAGRGLDMIQVPRDNNIELAVNEIASTCSSCTSCNCAVATVPGGNCDTCAPGSNCCTVSSCTYDPTKATCFCTYMDVIKDEDVAYGSTILAPIVASIPDYTIIAQYTQGSPYCCNSCAVDSTSVFSVNSVKTNIKSLVLTSTLEASQILIGSTNPISVTQVTNGFSALVDPSALDNTCNCLSEGTTSAVVLQNLDTWDYLAKYVICGKVTTNGTTCDFSIVAANASTIPATITTPLTFVAPNLCLPAASGNSPTLLNMQFVGSGELVNPIITAVGGPSPMPVTLSISGNLLLSTQANLQVTQNTKVCMQGMM